MKASIRHVISPPIETPKTLRGRILNSISPIDDGNYDNSGNFDASGSSFTSSMSSFASSGTSATTGVNNTNSSSASSPDSSHKIQIVELHPCQPILCYVDTNGNGIANENGASVGLGSFSGMGGGTGANSNGSITLSNGAQQAFSTMNADSSSRSVVSSTSGSSIGGGSNLHGSGVHNTNHQQSQASITSNIRSSKNSIVSPSLQVLKQRVVIQNHITNHTIAILSILDILQQYSEQVKRDSASNSEDEKKKSEDDDNDNEEYDDFETVPEKELIQTCKNFGFITSIQFMDLHVLQHHSGRVPLKEHKNSPPYLIIHFQKHILLYPTGHIMSNSGCSNSTWPCNSDGGMPNNSEDEMINNYIYNKPNKINNEKIIDIPTQTLHNANFTSKVILPIVSTNLLALGCSDGAVRFYSKWDQRIVKSVRGPNGKNDPIVGVLSIDPWDWSSAVLDEYSDEKLEREEEDMRKKSSFASTTSIGAGGAGTSAHRGTKANLSKIMTICASGTAYLWELQVCFIESSGNVKKFNLRPPLVKLDCPTSLSNAISSNSTNSLISPPSLINQNGTFIQRNCDNLKYDSDRQLLFWTVHPTNHSGLSKSYVVVWDLSKDRIEISLKVPKLGARSSDTNPHTPIHHPKTVIQIPNGDFILSDTTMISGFMHSSFPGEAYTCLAVSKDGNLSLIASSCQQPLKTSMKNVNDDAMIYHYFNFLSMQRSADEKVLGNLRYMKGGKIRITKIASSYSRPDVIVMSSNVGLIVVMLNDDDALLTGSIHSCFSNAKANSNGFIGAGNKILLVKNSSVYRATLDFNPSTHMPNPIGNLKYQEMVLFYRSPPALHRSIEFRARPVRIPPRLLPSPSGNFLCLFWHSENRYEIIHNSSITSAARKSTRDEGPEYSPAVDTGGNVLSFAWVGDEDVFALLYPPELSKNDSGVISSKKKNRTIPKVDLEEDDEDDGPIDPSKYKPRVELKVLVGVNKDAVEFSSSVAAATATFLGTLSLRGRHAPTCLFGGPVLCVGSLSQDKESSQMDGMAYFYCRRMNSEEYDNRASSFTSVGPALPYPDLIVWDEDGKVCAIIVGRRIAIYLADQPNFTLLSTAHLGTASETDAKVQSAKFLHGVLYCTTQTSIQCIFLGDLENSNVVCEVDSFILSSSNATFGTIQPSIRPQPQSMPLIRPSILGYLHGSLLVSTVYGVHAVSLSYPLIRIGALLASGHYTRAQRWFDTFHISHHEALANFLDRRGFPEMAIRLPGLSLETIVDLSLRYGFTDYLMNAIEIHGVKNFHMIDMGRGVCGDGSRTIIVCIGTYLLSQGKGIFVLNMADLCLSLGETGRKEAFTLATLLIALYPNEARELIKRAITEKSPNSKPLIETWPVAMYIKNHILQS